MELAHPLVGPVNGIVVGVRDPATVTLEAVAEAAGRSVDSRYSIFGTRDELLAARYEWYRPLDDLVRLSRDSASR
jgi:hypothetical protein